MRDLVHGCKKWQSAGILTDGKTYGIPKDLIFSFPVITENGQFKVVEGLSIDDELTMSSLKQTTEELLGERKAVEHLL